MDRGAWWATAQGVARVTHDLASKPMFYTTSFLSAAYLSFLNDRFLFKN